MTENLYKIDIKVKTQYIEFQSLPNENRFVFSYTVNIKNSGKIPIYKTLEINSWLSL